MEHTLRTIPLESNTVSLTKQHYTIKHKQPPPSVRPCQAVFVMDSFSYTASITETASFTETGSTDEFVCRVEEVYGITHNSVNIFEAYRRDALHQYAPSRLSDAASDLVHEPNPSFQPFGDLQFNSDSLLQQYHVDATELAGRRRQPNEYPYQFGNVLQSNWY